jgi:hypothetical protein
MKFRRKNQLKKITKNPELTRDPGKANLMFKDKIKKD